jgi:hypothetical protein
MANPGQLRRDVAALIAFIDGKHAEPHAIGRRANDCVSYVLGAVEAQTGFDPAPGAQWTTIKGGLRLVKRYGSLKAAFDAHFERVAPADAQRGDIAGVPDADLGLHPMSVEGTTLVGPGDDGNRRMKRSAMTCAWSAVRIKATPHV